jgi:hypothetical protein
VCFYTVLFVVIFRRIEVAEEGYPNNVCVVTMPPDFGCGETVLVDDVLFLVEVMCESDRSQRRIKRRGSDRTHRTPFFIFFQYNYL